MHIIQVQLRYEVLVYVFVFDRSGFYSFKQISLASGV